MATQRQIAEHLNLSPRRVRDVLQTLGLPTRGADLDETRKRYIEHLRRTAAAHGEAGRGLDLAQERAALAAAQRTRVEIDIAERRRELVDAESLRRGLRGAWRSVRDGILSVPDRVAAILAAETDAEKVRLTLDGELRKALTRLADERHELVAQAERGDSEGGGGNG